MNNLKKVLSDPATEEILQVVASASEGGAKQRSRGSSTGITPATGPSLTPATPSTGAPSSISPLNRTPTTRSPSGNIPTAKTPPGNALAGLVSQPGEQPATSSGNHRPVPNAASTAPATAQAGTDKQELAPTGNTAQPSLVRTVLPWVALAIFLIAAIGVLILAIAK